MLAAESGWRLQAPPPRTDLEALLDHALQRDEIRAARLRARVPT
jgi:hypothetical protein